jgi:hypothetical protein
VFYLHMGYDWPLLLRGFFRSVFAH